MVLKKMFETFKLIEVTGQNLYAKPTIIRYGNFWKTLPFDYNYYYVFSPQMLIFAV